MAARRNLKRLSKQVACSVALFLSCAGFSPAPGQAGPGDAACMRLGADDSLEQFYPLFENLIADIYKTAGFCAVSVPMSPKRIEQMIAAGTLDGDWIRIEGYARSFQQDLIAVPVPLFKVESVFLSRPTSNFDGTAADLKGRSVGFQSGFRWIEKNLPLFGAKTVEIPSGLPVNDLLARGRFEVFATDGVRGHAIQARGPTGNMQLRLHSWEKISFYHLVHKRHAEKVEPLQHAFEAAIARGAFKEIYALPGLEEPRQRN